MKSGKKLRINGIDCFIILVAVVLLASFFFKGPLSHLFAREEGMTGITYSFVLNDQTEAPAISVGDSLFTADDRSLGNVVSLYKQTDAQGLEHWCCEAEGYAGYVDGVYLITREISLFAGAELSLFCNGQAYSVKVLQIRYI